MVLVFTISENNTQWLRPGVTGSRDFCFQRASNITSLKYNLSSSKRKEILSSEVDLKAKLVDISKPNRKFGFNLKK